MHDISRGEKYQKLDIFDLNMNTVINVRNVVRNMTDKEAMKADEVAEGMFQARARVGSGR